MQVHEEQSVHAMRNNLVIHTLTPGSTSHPSNDLKCISIPRVAQIRMI